MNDSITHLQDWSDASNTKASPTKSPRWSKLTPRVIQLLPDAACGMPAGSELPSMVRTR
jgi:hypothetical protein